MDWPFPYDSDAIQVFLLWSMQYIFEWVAFIGRILFEIQRSSKKELKEKEKLSVDESQQFMRMAIKL